MRLLDFLFAERRNTAGIAKDRLKIVLAHERANRDAPDFLAALQKDLLESENRATPRCSKSTSRSTAPRSSRSRTALPPRFRRRRRHRGST